MDINIVFGIKQQQHQTQQHINIDIRYWQSGLGISPSEMHNNATTIANRHQAMGQLVEANLEEQTAF